MNSNPSPVCAIPSYHCRTGVARIAGVVSSPAFKTPRISVKFYSGSGNNCTLLPAGPRTLDRDCHSCASGGEGNYPSSSDIGRIQYPRAVACFNKVGPIRMRIINSKNTVEVELARRSAHNIAIIRQVCSDRLHDMSIRNQRWACTMAALLNHPTLAQLDRHSI